MKEGQSRYQVQDIIAGMQNSAFASRLFISVANFNRLQTRN